MRFWVAFACGNKQAGRKTWLVQDSFRMSNLQERRTKVAARAQAISGRPAGKRLTWKGLADHYKRIAKLHLRQIFADDPKRGERLNVEALGLFLDYSKNRITEETLKLLIQLAEESHLQKRTEPIFRGKRITPRETRRFCTPLCGLPETPPSWWMARTWYPRCMPCSTAWRTSPIECGVASGKATPASGFAM